MMVRAIFGKEDLMSVWIPICIIPGNENICQKQFWPVIIKFRLLKNDSYDSYK